MLIKSCRIPFESLVDYAENRAPTATTERIRAHLAADCANCRATLDWMANATPQIHAAQQVEVPAFMLNRAYDLFRQKFPVPARPAWQAFLQFDSRNTLAFAGARGQAEGAFQMRFSAEQHDITLFQEPIAGGAWYLIGQVLPREGDAVIIPLEITLVGPDGATQDFSPQAEEFHLSPIAAGTYKMTIRWEDGELVLPEISVGTQDRAQ